MNRQSAFEVYSKWCRVLLYTLVTTIIFEGIIRKFIPAIRMPLFFLKDIICIFSIFFIVNIKYSAINEVKNLWLRLLFLLFPVFLYTIILDPILAIFGLKQYFLFMAVAILVPAAFPPQKSNNFEQFYTYISFLLIPTAIIAVLQNTLPPSHWLNRSVEGDSLENFSAAGFLRVSSTFSFTAQYSFYIVASAYFLAVFLANKSKTLIINLLKVVFPVVLLISAFITGGRTAVVGCVGLFVVGYGLLAFKGSVTAIRNWVIMSLLLLGSYTVGTLVFPQGFAAYQERSKGRGNVSHNEELADRILGSFTLWIDWFVKQDVTSIAFGNGIGVMSNGSDKLSDYARKIRVNGFWMETDLATTAWEGGSYLLVTWNFFRILIIFHAFTVWRKLQNKVWMTSGAFLVAYIAIIGIIGTLGIQPPLAIWWWLAYGTLITMKNFEMVPAIENSETNP